MPRQILQHQAQLQALQEQVRLNKATVLAELNRLHLSIKHMQQQIKAVASNVWPSANRTFVCAELWQNQWQFASQQTQSLADLKQQLQTTEASVELQKHQLRQLLTRETVLAEQQRLLMSQLEQKIVTAQEQQLSALSRRR